MPQPKVRIVGAGYSTFNYQGRPIAYLESVQDAGQKPYETAHESIYAIGDRHPREFVTQYVLSEGSLTLSIRELWNEEVWWQLAGLAGTDNIVDVWDALRAQPGAVTCSKIITPPTGSGTPRIIEYQNCIVTSVPDGDSIDIAGLSVAKTLQITYTHKIRR
jgi:hypothetical protein